MLVKTEMEPSLRTYEMKNIEKNMEKVNRYAVHPKHFRSQAANSAPNGQGSTFPSMSQQNQFPYGGAFGSNDPKSVGRFTSNYTENPDLSNYPSKILSLK